MRYAVGTKESPIGVYVQEGGRGKEEGSDRGVLEHLLQFSNTTPQ
jgi:hypothetical protein